MMRPFATATAPSSMTRRRASIVTTVPPLTMRSTRRGLWTTAAEAGAPTRSVCANRTQATNRRRRCLLIKGGLQFLLLNHPARGVEEPLHHQRPQLLPLLVAVGLVDVDGLALRVEVDRRGEPVLLLLTLNLQVFDDGLVLHARLARQRPRLAEDRAEPHAPEVAERELNLLHLDDGVVVSVDAHPLALALRRGRQRQQEREEEGPGSHRNLRSERESSAALALNAAGSLLLGAGLFEEARVEGVREQLLHLVRLGVAAQVGEEDRKS